MQEIERSTVKDFLTALIGEVGVDEAEEILGYCAENQLAISELVIAVRKEQRREVRIEENSGLDPLFPHITVGDENDDITSNTEMHPPASPIWDFGAPDNETTLLDFIDNDDT